MFYFICKKLICYLLYLQKPWNKFFPYGFGVIVGILIWKYNNTNIKGNFVGRLSRMIQENPIISWLMHIVGVIIIATIIITIHPIDHDRGGDTKIASSLWLVLSQIFVPLGLTLNFLPMCFEQSLRLRAFMNLSIFKPFSILLYIMIPLQGVVVFQVGYNLRYGIYFDFKFLFVICCAFYVIFMMFSLIFAILFIMPFSFPVRAFFNKYRTFRPDQGSDSKNESEKESLLDEHNEDHKNDDEYIEAEQEIEE